MPRDSLRSVLDPVSGGTVAPVEGIVKQSAGAQFRSQSNAYWADIRLLSRRLNAEEPGPFCANACRVATWISLSVNTSHRQSIAPRISATSGCSHMYCRSK